MILLVFEIAVCACTYIYINIFITFIVLCIAMRREEKDAWLAALRHLLQPGNFDTRLLQQRYVYIHSN